MTPAKLLAATALAAALSGPALAQDAADIETDWYVYVAPDESECIAISSPTRAEYFRDGVSVTANTDEPFLTITWRPAEGAMGQVAYQGGYPFDPERVIDASIGASDFDLNPADIWAWPPDAAADATLIAAMKEADEIELSAWSSRGTNVVHTFSLRGFGPAVDEAARRCGG